ncbi:hypothetical protein K456DRAFT_35288 [Colletotrichum gloeosporioides 23]|nr:hypothetical protein K456DRAFT_35288 [Colletotrichum gloeosporioides 23]
MPASIPGVRAASTAVGWAGLAPVQRATMVFPNYRLLACATAGRNPFAVTLGFILGQSRCEPVDFSVKCEGRRLATPSRPSEIPVSASGMGELFLEDSLTYPV